MKQIFSRLASLKVTLLGITLLLMTILVTYRHVEILSTWILYPLLLLSLNLFAAILVNTRFRRHSWLLVFHVCLLLVVILAGITSLLHFDGRIEIVEGQRFTDGVLSTVSKGYWYQQDLSDVNFIQGPIEVSFHEGLSRNRTYSEIYLPTVNNATEIVAVGDKQALELHGYRFRTTANKGYAAALSWTDLQTGEKIRGYVHFPSFPYNDWKQKNQWQLPNGMNVLLELEFDSPLRAGQRWVMNNRVASSLLVTMENNKHKLREGNSLQLDGVSMHFDGVRIWMGYSVNYNPVLPWLFVAAFAAVMSLGFYYHNKFSVKLHISQQYHPVHIEHGNEQLPSL